MINEVLEPDSDDWAGKGAKVSNNQLVVVSCVADTQQQRVDICKLKEGSFV